MYFLDAFRAAFPSIALLVGNTVDPTEACGYVSQMLGKQPESSSTQALEGSVSQLLPHLDTASLRAAPAQERVAEMQKLSATDECRHRLRQDGRDARRCDDRY